MEGCRLGEISADASISGSELRLCLICAWSDNTRAPLAQNHQWMEQKGARCQWTDLP